VSVAAAPEVSAAPRPLAQMRARVLVTGSSGMLGRDLVPALAGAGLEVFARDRTDLDITSERQVQRAFVEARPDIVVNCAAFTKVDACEHDPRAREVNGAAVRRLADHCIRRSARLVQISTDFVFDGLRREPYREDDPTGPLSEYGASKLAGEREALRAPESLVVRTSWLFGGFGWNFVEAIVKQVEDGRRTLTVVSDQRGRPTATTDLAEAIVSLLWAGATGIVHFANRGEVSWWEWASEIVALSGVSGVEVRPIDSATLGRPARRPAYSVLDTTLYERLTGQPIRHYREPLADYLARRVRPQA
jgi:dTDP-4-dehydrorhamnose reductase